ncbi:alpha/beta fold hydrolase [Devosia submarina]|uniref:carboxylesterase family protein n=1 Tax=Devosia submarina TaxID=1173082 RepID=UPI000D387853|nr:alpha/beta fold hydrolase [Devosia submarina]
MISKKSLVSIGLGSVMAAASALAMSPSAYAEQTQHTMSKPVQVEMDYLLDLPANYDETAAEAYPLIVYLHGGGAADLEQVAENSLPALVAAGDYPFIMVSPRNPREEEFFPQESVAAVVEEIASTYHVDRDRIYLVGNSRGAFSAFQIIQNYPDVYAAVVAVSGGGIPHYLDRVRAWTPFWIFHGTNDDTVRFIESAQMVQKLKELGGDRELRFSAYEGATHEETDDLAWAEPDFFEWLLKQTRVAPENYTPTAKSTDFVGEPVPVLK